jgi:hypothetical protein
VHLPLALASRLGPRCACTTRPAPPRATLSRPQVVFQAARRLAAQVRDKRRAPAADAVDRTLEAAAVGASLAAILPGAGLKTK